ncbi:unnamed protein product, partial [Gadus morhua 'NCC']
MALQGVILYLLVLFPAALLIVRNCCARNPATVSAVETNSTALTPTAAAWTGVPYRSPGLLLCCEQDKNQAPLACCGQQPFDPSSAVFCGLTILAHPLRCCGG